MRFKSFSYSRIRFCRVTIWLTTAKRLKLHSLVWFITGGLNLQSIHHLLPSVSCVHYPAMYPKFLAICEKHGCLPDRADGFAHALAKHWSYVYRLGKGDAVPWPEGWPARFPEFPH